MLKIRFCNFLDLHKISTVGATDNLEYVTGIDVKLDMQCLNTMQHNNNISIFR